jgi:hypothetical protein
LQWSLPGSWNAVPQDILNGLTTGELTVAVGSPAFLKGSIWPTFQSFTAVLAGQNQVPTPVQNTAAGGVALGALVGNSLWYEIYLSGVSSSNIVAAHFHGSADATTVAGVKWDLKDSLSHTGGRDTIVLNTKDVVNLYNGQYYLNIHSNKEPDGELRGQFYHDPVWLGVYDGNAIPFVSSLSNGRLKSPFPTGIAGMALFRLQDDNSLEYIVKFSNIQSYGTAISGLAVYELNDDDTWSKAFDLDLSTVSISEVCL